MKKTIFGCLMFGIFGCGNENNSSNDVRPQESSYVEILNRDWVALGDEAFRAREAFPSLDSDLHFEITWDSSSDQDELQLFLFADDQLENGLRLQIRSDSVILYSDRSDIELDLSPFLNFLNSDELNFSFDLHHSHAHLLVWDENDKLVFDSGVAQISLPPRGLGRHWGFQLSGGELKKLHLGGAKLDDH